MNLEKLRKQSRVYEWDKERRASIGANQDREYRIDKIYDDLFAAGFTNHFLGDVNGAVFYYPILMYTLARCLQAQHILEIGIYQGFTSYYLAKAAQIGGGHFYGMDIDAAFCSLVSRNLIEKGLDHTIVSANTKEIKKEEFKEMLNFPKIDFAFLDGEHNTETLLHEVELIYPHLTTGTGMICLHDVHCICDGALAKLEKDPRFETISLPFHNGLGLLRKIEGLDTAEQRASRCGVEKLGCQMGETVEEMEARHAKGDFYTDYVNSMEHDAQMIKEHPEMANFPYFDRLKERERRYPSK